MAPEETSGSDLGEALVHAARDGDLARIDALLAQGADVDQRDRHKSTAMDWAAGRGRADIVHRLIQAGAALDLVDELGNTPLLVAVFAGCTAAVMDLLDHGADIEHRNCLDETALFIAAACPFTGSEFGRSWPRTPGHDPILRELLSRGADVDVVDCDGASAIGAAAARGNVAAVRALHAAGAALGYEMEEGDRSLLRWAAGRGYLALIEAELDAGAPIDDHDDDWTPLAHAAFNHRVDAVTLLLQRGASVDDEARRRINDLARLHETYAEGAVDKIRRAADVASAHFDYQHAHDNLLTAYTLFGWVGLEEACERVRPKMADLESAFRAKIMEVHHGETPLLVKVAGWGFTDEVIRLLDGGADVEQEDAEGLTALINAVRHGHAEVVSCLLHLGANPDHADKAGDTPLLIAAEYGRAAIVEDLLLYDADIDRRNGMGRTALFLAAACPQRRAPNDPAAPVRNRGHDEVVRALLRRDALAGYYDAEGRQPLEAAADAENIAAMLDLLEFGEMFDTDLRAWNEGREGPVCPGLVQALDDLLGGGWRASPHDDRPYRGWTPLSQADAPRREALLTMLLKFAPGYRHQAWAIIEERIAWLEARAEQAWEQAYDARGSSAAGYYSAAKGFLDDARGLALRIERPDLAQRLKDRLDHIKVVFRSQFS